MSEVILNADQAAAALAIKFWFMDQTSTKQCFTLAGYAGTGKTFLINYLIDDILQIDRKDVAFVAPTGKAASVLIQKGNKATTIHKLIYNVVEKERIVIVGGSEIKTKKIEFVKKSSIPSYKLIIVDEVSMVEKNIFEDLLSFGIPILCCGDSGQLRPIGASNGMLDHPDITLNQIVRQSADNPIIQLATKARMGLPIICSNLGDVIITQEGRYTEAAFTKLLLKADMIICGTNTKRNRINQIVRTAKGYSGIYPNPGEKVICNVNNWEVELDKNGDYNLVNGIISRVNSFEIVNKEEHLGKISITPDFLEDETDDLICDTAIFSDNKFMYDMHQRALLMEDGNYKIKKFISARNENESKEDYRNRLIAAVMDAKHAEDDMQVNRFEYAYAITAHKSQGSEWNNVVVFDDSNVFGRDGKNWLYTAITRAKKKLVIIK